MNIKTQKIKKRVLKKLKLKADKSAPIDSPDEPDQDQESELDSDEEVGEMMIYMKFGVFKIKFSGIASTCVRSETTQTGSKCPTNSAQKFRQRSGWLETETNRFLS